MQMEGPFARWSPWKSSCPAAALKVMDGGRAPPQPAPRLPLPPGALGGPVPTAASERCCYSGRDLAPATCRPSIHGIPSFCSLRRSVSMAEHAPWYAGFAFNISPPTAEHLIDEANQWMSRNIYLYAKRLKIYIFKIGHIF